MKKYICGATALLLAATLLFGCGNGNVSNQPGGRITDPTSITPTIIPEPTMTSETNHSANAGTNPTTQANGDNTLTTEMTTPFPDGTTGTEDSSSYTERNRTDINP